MRKILRNPSGRWCPARVLVPAFLGLLAVATAVPARAAVLYDFTFFDQGGAVVGDGFLEVDAAVRDAGIDLNDVMSNGPFPPVGSRFVAIADLTAIEFTLFGTTLRKSDLAPSLRGPDGVVFDAAGAFLQFIDPNLGTTDLSATDVVFGTPGNRVIFDEAFPDGFEVQLAGATDCIRPDGALPGDYACRFAVSQRAPVPEPASAILALSGVVALLGSRRRVHAGRVGPGAI